MQATYQNGLTIVTPILEGHTGALEAVLEEFDESLPDHEDIPFGELTRVHFIRWVILPATTDDLDRETTAQLVLSTNYDEPLEDHLKELVEVARPALDRVYRHCQEYPPREERSLGNVISYLRAHDVGYDTLYVGTRGRSVTQIRREAALRTAIQEFIDEQSQNSSFREQSPAEVRTAIQEFVRSTAEFKWAEETPPQTSNYWPQPWDGFVVGGMATVLVVLVALPRVFSSGWVVLVVELAAVLGIVGAYLGWLRWREQRDPAYPPVTDYDHVARLAQKEDYIVQNQMSSVTTVKAGRLRQATLYAVLWVIDLFGRYVYTAGRLGSISSIHFARWVVIDAGRRLVFFSNFDGSWENYLGDFIDKAASGLTAVWSNTVGFPRTRFLVGAGARDEQRFKAYARNSQVLTQVWYSAYRDLTVQNINNNSAIRAGLFGDQTSEETRLWLLRL